MADHDGTPTSAARHSVGGIEYEDTFESLVMESTRDDIKTPMPEPVYATDIQKDDQGGSGDGGGVSQTEQRVASPVPSLTPVGDVERFDEQQQQQQQQQEQERLQQLQQELHEKKMQERQQQEKIHQQQQLQQEQQQQQQQQREQQQNQSNNHVEQEQQQPFDSPPARLPPIERQEDFTVETQNQTQSNRSMSKREDTNVIGDAGGDHSEGGSIGCCGYVLYVFSIILVVLTFPLSLCVCIKVVQEYERAVIFRLGRIKPGGAQGPGMFFILPCMDDFVKVDIRTVSIDVPPQEILTRDSVTVAVDAVVYYRVANSTMSVCNVEDAARSTRLLSATTLRNVLGTKTLGEVLSDRENISHSMQRSLDDATDPWGIKVERVEIKDVRLPMQLQRAMAAEAEAAREAKAKVIAAEGEQKSSLALKEAADIMVQSPAALQLRYLQTLNSISAEKNSTIIFPLPIDMLGGLVK